MLPVLRFMHHILEPLNVAHSALGHEYEWHLTPEMEAGDGNFPDFVLRLRNAVREKLTGAILTMEGKVSCLGLSVCA